MPTRSYYFPKEFSHVEAILRAQADAPDDASFRHFRELGMPPLFSGFDLAVVLGIGPGILASILKKPERHYRDFMLKKSDGSKRLISSPRTYLKVIQWWILDNILDRMRVSDHAYGFVRGRSIVDNASHHLGSKHFLTVDIKSFFDATTVDQVNTVFLKHGYNKSTSMMLSRICTRNGSLPQGAPTSPALGNQILLPLDEYLSSNFSNAGIKYSRYADDITLSSRIRLAPEVLSQLETAVKHLGFTLKAEKTRFVGPGGRSEVTGLVVREFIQPPRKWRKFHRSAIHHLSLKASIDESDKNYLKGIKGYSSQFPDSITMRGMREQAIKLLGETVSEDVGAP